MRRKFVSRIVALAMTAVMLFTTEGITGVASDFNRKMNEAYYSSEDNSLPNDGYFCDNSADGLDVSDNSGIDISSDDKQGDDEILREEEIGIGADEQYGISLDDLVMPEGSGTEDDPYIVTNEKEFLYLSYNNPILFRGTGKYVELHSDINLKSTNYTDNIKSRCVFGYDFNFDGKNHKIKGLTNTLFGQKIYEGTVIQNLVIEDSHITNDKSMSSSIYNCFIAGENRGTIKNITIASDCSIEFIIDVQQSSGYAAAICSANNYGTIEKCVNYANITTKGSNFTAGIAISTEDGSTITGCENYGKITGSMSVAGIVAVVQRWGTLSYPAKGVNISKCSNYGEITGKTCATGIFGEYDSQRSFLSVDKCNNYGNIISDNMAGGICSSVANYATISDCFSYGNITAKDAGETGGFAAEVGAGTVLERCGVSGKDNDFATMKITSGWSNAAIGGFVGNFCGSMYNCFARVNIDLTNSAYVGGLMGESNDYPEISNAYFAGKITTHSCNKTPGGIIGKWDYYSNIFDVFYDGTLFSGKAAGDKDGALSEAKKTSAQFASGAVRDLLNQYYSSPVWFQTTAGEGKENYPELVDKSIKYVEGEGIYYLSNWNAETKMATLDKQIKAYLSDEIIGNVGDDLSGCVRRYVKVNINPDTENGRNVISEIYVLESKAGIADINGDTVSLNGKTYSLKVAADANLKNTPVLLHFVDYANDPTVDAITVIEKIGIKSLGEISENKLVINGFADYRKAYDSSENLIRNLNKFKDYNLEKNYFCALSDKYFNVYDAFNGIPSYNAETIDDAVFHFASAPIGGKENIESYSMYYKDEWFKVNDAPGKTKEYNHELVRMALRAEMAAFDASSLKKGSFGKDNIEELMDTLHYDRKVFNGYGFNSTNSVAYAIASKDVTWEDGTTSSIIMVTLRGAGYGNEWGGNLNMGSGVSQDTHDGFELGAKGVLEGIEDYLDTYVLEEDKVIWITGYSRGAAITNLVAAHLDDGTIPGFGTQNVFAFCFECPRNTTDENVAHSKYQNIKCFINPIDLVPKLAMSAWGFNRYGDIYSFPSSSNEENYWAYYKPLMEKEYGKLIADYANTYGLTDAQKKALLKKITAEGSLQCLNFDQLTNMLANCANNRVNYVKYFQPQFMNIAENTLGGGTPDSSTIIAGVTAVRRLMTGNNLNGPLGFPNPFARFSDAILAASVMDMLAGTSVSWNPVLGIPVFDGMEIQALNCHWPELSLAWVDALSSDEMIANKAKWRSNKYALLSVNCPVNVNVYDSNGTLVGQIIDDQVVELEQTLISCRVDENNQKQFVFPSYADYRIEIVATQNGQMDISLATYAGEISELQKVVSFRDLDMEKGDVFDGTFEEETASFSKGSENILPNDVITEADNLYCNLVVSAEGNGTVRGNASVVFGEASIVTATPYSGEEFIGWFAVERDEFGEIVSQNFESASAEYKITVAGDTELLALFTINKTYYSISFINDYSNIDEEAAPIVDVLGGVVPGTTINLPQNPVLMIYDKEYAFGGWFTQKDGKGSQLTEKTKINSDMTVYAYWLDGREYVTESDKFFVSDIADQVYSGKKITPFIIVRDGSTVLVKDKDYTVTYSNNTNVGAASVKIKGKGNYTQTITTEFRIIPKELSDDDISVTIADKAYTGNTVKSAPAVKWGSKTLNSKNDYSVSYASDDDDKCVAKGIVTVTVTGKGNYGGSKTVTYRIADKDISKAYFSVGSVTYRPYDTLEADVKVYSDKNKKKLISQFDESTENYLLEYGNNTKAGTGYVNIVGVNDYCGCKKLSFKIDAYDIGKDPEKVITAAINDDGSFIYTGSAIAPKISLFDSGVLLTEGVDYKLTYKNNIKAAETTSTKAPQITVTGKGNYKGSFTMKFTIDKKSLLVSNVILSDITPMAYTGRPVKPSFKLTFGQMKLGKNDYTVTYKNNVNVSEENVADAPAIVITGKGNYKDTIEATFRIYAGKASSFVVEGLSDCTYSGTDICENPVVYADKAAKTRGEALEEGRDYLLSYANTLNTGKAVITITGIGAYGGIKQVTYKILPININSTECAIRMQDEDIVYSGSKLTPEPIVSGITGQLTKNKDYTLSYANNMNAANAAAKKAPSVTVKGKGNYSGQAVIKFDINPMMLTPDNCEVTVEDAKYTGSLVQPKVTVKLKSGKTLSSKNDFSVVYENNKDKSEKNSETAPCVYISGKGNYSGAKTVFAKFRIYAKAASTMGVPAVPAAMYTGKTIKPEIMVYKSADAAKKKISKDLLTEGVDYTIEYANNTKVGKGTIIIKGIGEYGGTKTVSFVILPKWLKWFTL